MRLAVAALVTLVLAGAAPATGPVRARSETPIAVPRGVLWLGPSYRGNAARATRVRFEEGTVVKIDYQLLAVWNYRAFVPPPVVAAESTAVQTYPLRTGGTARFYLGPRGTAVVEVDKGGRTAALVSRYAGKVDLVEASQQVRTKP